MQKEWKANMNLPYLSRILQNSPTKVSFFGLQLIKFRIHNQTNDPIFWKTLVLCSALFSFSGSPPTDSYYHKKIKYDCNFCDRVACIISCRVCNLHFTCVHEKYYIGMRCSYDSITHFTNILFVLRNRVV